MIELPELLDPDTLREVHPDHDLLESRMVHLQQRVRYDPDPATRVFEMSELAGLMLVVGKDFDALGMACWAIEIALHGGTELEVHVAAVRYAQASQRRGDYGESTMTYLELLVDAHRFGPEIEAYTYWHAGENDFAQENWVDARDNFAHALELCERHRMAPDAARIALAAANRRLAGETS